LFFGEHSDSPPWKTDIAKRIKLDGISEPKTWSSMEGHRRRKDDKGDKKVLLDRRLEKR
jgi:hypothetical protein